MNECAESIEERLAEGYVVKHPELLKASQILESIIRGCSLPTKEGYITSIKVLGKEILEKKY